MRGEKEEVRGSWFKAGDTDVDWAHRYLTMTSFLRIAPHSLCSRERRSPSKESSNHSVGKELSATLVAMGSHSTASRGFLGRRALYSDGNVVQRTNIDSVAGKTRDAKQFVENDRR